jgi:hypothetical protein
MPVPVTQQVWFILCVYVLPPIFGVAIVIFLLYRCGYIFKNSKKEEEVEIDRSNYLIQDLNSSARTID